ncbi:hypothetical protein CMI37_36335 [Candidatus Pacearchaeota archaeon]|jgi:hypothetical protein|nr:hypothetical protein [Candidatus Pacearchaeota archaeon]|tara:strand:- start:137 stop:541 length:405 start_codon:yes stop_codon:yes gene_type:complete
MSDIHQWVNVRFNCVPLDLLADKDGRHDFEEWERLNPPDYEAICNRICGDTDCKGDCEEEAEEYLHAFPFAWGTAFLPDYDVQPDEATAAGFLLYEFRGQQVLGIDGGGYDFYEQHWAPLKSGLMGRRYEGQEA